MGRGSHWSRCRSHADRLVLHSSREGKQVAQEEGGQPRTRGDGPAGQDGHRPGGRRDTAASIVFNTLL